MLLSLGRTLDRKVDKEEPCPEMNDSTSFLSVAVTSLSVVVVVGFFFLKINNQGAKTTEPRLEILGAFDCP